MLYVPQDDSNVDFSFNSHFSDKISLFIIIIVFEYITSHSLQLVNINFKLK